jgi:integrase
VVFSKFSERLLAYAKATYSPRNVEVYERVLREFIACLGDRPMIDITPYDIERFKAWRMEKVSPVSVNIDLRTLKAALNRAFDWGLLSKHPCKRTIPVRVPDHSPAYLNEADFVRLCESIKQKWLLDIIIFAVATGMRQGEILNLRWNEVDLSRRIVRVGNKDGFRTKAGKERNVPLNDMALKIIAGRGRTGRYVFVNTNGEKVHRDTLTKTFKKKIRKLGLEEELHFHSLRHTFASWVVQRGVPLYHVQKLLGHSSIKITEIYSHLEEDNLRSCVNVLDTMDSLHAQENIVAKEKA